jgi:hypothetical protein
MVSFQGENMIELDFTVIAVVMFFIILISIQFTLNKIFLLLKEIKAILLTKRDK